MRTQGLSRSPDWYKSRLQKIENQKQFLIRMSIPREAKYKRPWKSYRLKSWKAYSKKVWDLTFAQPLNELIGFENRGFMDHHVDHMVSVSDGYFHNLPEEWVADISNLRIITAEQNRLKGVKSLPDKLIQMISRKEKVVLQLT